MGRKRGYASEESHLAGEADGSLPPVVRSRRERAVKARLRSSEEAGESSFTDSGSGDHYSPVNVTDVPRSSKGHEMTEELTDRAEGRRSRPAKREALRSAKRRRGDGPSKRGPGGIFKTAAIKILTEAGSLLSSGAIYDRAMRQGLVSESAGKTPEATMAAALYTDIKKYRSESTFIKPREGLFGLRDWTREDCTILTPAERADIAAAKDLDRDSGLEVSGTSGMPHSSGREQTPSHKPTKQRTKSKREIPRPGRTSRPSSRRPAKRQARSHSVPPTSRADSHDAAQPALSGPPAIFANERLQALFAAVDQVSGSSATSDLASIAESVTESEGDPETQPLSGTAPDASGRLSLEPEAESTHNPLPFQIKAETDRREDGGGQAGGAQQIGEPVQQPEVKFEGGADNIEPGFAPALPEGPAGFDATNSGPSVAVASPPLLSLGVALTALEQAAALQQIEALERQLQLLDHSNKADPQVGNCHMQLSSLYLAIGHREKAVQNYMIALERCEAMLT